MNIQRLLDESADLALKISGLRAFIFYDSSSYHSLPLEDRELMYEQYVAMEEYQRVLKARIKRSGNA